ncbi:MAG: hypothetical protein DRJ15_09260 [Bacteroidetes bacterium]|nr:MAG: hypothetical protein DRJ15_09260 [Bacteroidota bacterium]
MNKRIFLMLAILAIPVIIITSCKKDEGDDTPVNNAPVASFTVDPGSGNTQTAFNLDASGSTDQETPANELLVRWDGNDDGTWETEFTTVKTATVTYDTEGTYTIRLQVKDGGGLTSATTQQVTVTANGNEAPDAPANPNPEDGGTDIIIIVQLQWTGSDPEADPLTFDVYFGTSQDPPLVSEGKTENSYDPGTLAYETTYYWKITAHDDHDNSSTGPLWSFTTGSQSFSCGDDFTDARDGKTYGSVQIVDQCWMAQNLNIGDRIDGSQDMSDNSTIEKYCFNDEETECNTYGGLYQWDEMMQYAKNNSPGICPDGWHLPSLQEWETLEIALGMPEEQATATSGWQGTVEGNMLKYGGSTGFDALMGGNRSSSGNFILGGLGTAFWTATQSTTYNAKARSFDTDHSQINHTNYSKEYGHAVRCVED